MEFEVWRYQLPEHVYASATCDRDLVFLDIRADKYFGVSRAAADLVGPLIRGWVSGSEIDTDGGRRLPPAAVSLLRFLLAKRLLVNDSEQGRAVDSIQLQRADQELGGKENLFWAGFGRVGAVVAAYIASVATLRWSTFEDAIQGQIRRKHDITQIAASDTDAILALSRTYKQLRPLLFASRDQCLLDSLALVKFLARYRLFPTWVIGVQTRPFAAHSWVQYNNIVLNASSDFVNAFTPIVTI